MTESTMLMEVIEIAGKQYMSVDSIVSWFDNFKQQDHSGLVDWDELIRRIKSMKEVKTVRTATISYK